MQTLNILTAHNTEELHAEMQPDYEPESQRETEQASDLAVMQEIAPAEAPQEPQEPQESQKQQRAYKQSNLAGTRLSLPVIMHETPRRSTPWQFRQTTQTTRVEIASITTIEKKHHTTTFYTATTMVEELMPTNDPFYTIDSMDAIHTTDPSGLIDPTEAIQPVEPLSPMEVSDPIGAIDTLDTMDTIDTIHTLETLQLPILTKPSKVSELIIERIRREYSLARAQREGICYWPAPLPTPDYQHNPTPLILFRPTANTPTATNAVPKAHSTETGKQIPLVPLTQQEVLEWSRKSPARPALQFPLGLIDKPEQQKQETLLIDLQGMTGALSGGPLLLVGTQNSGKATALQSMLLWLTSRYNARQLRCIVIDPTHDLDLFQTLPHLCNDEQQSLWTDGSNDEELYKVIERATALQIQRRERYKGLRWNADTLAQLWQAGEEAPLLLLVISQLQRFSEHTQAQQAIKRLFFTFNDARELGIYSVLSSSEVGLRHISADILSKISTRLSLFLHEQQRAEFFGRLHPMEPIPGRGLLQTADQQINHVQLALPVPGSSESERYENLKQAIATVKN